MTLVAQVADRIGIGSAHQRLRGEVEDQLGPGGGDRVLERSRVANVALDMGDQLGEARLGEEARVGRGKREAGDVGAELVQPQRQPAALEAGMTGDQHAAAAPGIAFHQHFHGAPLAHNSSRWTLSRSVSIGCQKPLWR